MGFVKGDWPFGEVCSVVGEVDRESLGETAGALVIAGGADEDAARDTVGLGDDVEHEVNAVVEIDVGMAGRAEDDAGAFGETSSGVSGGIVEGEIGFGFGDAGVEIAVDDDFTKQIASDDGCGARKEVTI